MANRPWKTKEHAQFLEMYPYFPNPYIAEKLGRTVASIENRAIKDNLKKARGFKDDSHVFSAGQTPWNKGKKHNPPGSEKGRFKPGHTFDRSRPLGAERVRAGILERKVNAFTGIGHRQNFKAVKNITWEAVNGPVPKGHVLRVTTGDPYDATKIECIACITRGENFTINASKNRSESAKKGWRTKKAMHANLDPNWTPVVAERV